MKAAAIFFILCLSTLNLQAQNYLTFGVGFSAAFFDVDELLTFRDTYNRVNFDNLSELMGTLNGGEGLRFEAGYRHHGRFSRALLVGWQATTRRTNARFNNNENRVLQMDVRNLYSEIELSRGWRRWFFGGVTTFAFKRHVELKAEYAGAQGAEATKRLNGTYEADASLSGHIGVLAGFKRRRIFLTLKVLYPVFATDTSDRLRDESPDKVLTGTDVFPDDFISFWAKEPYEGVPNKISGVFVTMNIAFALEI